MNEKQYHSLRGFLIKNITKPEFLRYSEEFFNHLSPIFFFWCLSGNEINGTLGSYDGYSVGISKILRVDQIEFCQSKCLQCAI